MKNTPKRARTKGRGLSRRDNQYVGLLYALPFIIGFLLIFVRIFATSVQFAFSEMSLGEKGFELTFVGLEKLNYALRIDPVYRDIMQSNVTSLLTTIPVVLIFSLFVAVVLARRVPGRTAFRAIFFLPVIVSTGLISKLDMNNAVMTAMNSSAAVETGAEAAAGAMGSLGDISMFLQSMNFSPSLISTVSGMAAGVVNIINLSGVQILIFLAGIQSISPSIYESANVEGATAWEMFWKITLPMVSPMLLVNVFYTIIDSLTRDNNQLMEYIRGVMGRGMYGESAAMAWLYFLVVAVILAVLVAIISRFVFTYQREKK